MNGSSEHSHAARFLELWFLYYRTMKIDGARDIVSDKRGVGEVGMLYYDEFVRGKIDASEFRDFFVDTMKSNLYFLSPAQFEEAVTTWRRRKIRPVKRFELQPEQMEAVHKYTDATAIIDLFPPESRAAIQQLDSMYASGRFNTEAVCAMTPGEIEQRIRKFLLVAGLREVDLVRIEEYWAATTAALDACRDENGKLSITKYLQRTKGILRAFSFDQQGARQ